MSNMKIKSEIFFFIGYILMLAGQMLATITFIQHYVNYLTYLGFAFLIIYIIICKDKYTKKNIFLLSICAIFITIVSFTVDDKKMIKLLLLIIAFKNIDFENFLKQDFKFRLMFVIIVMFLSLFGLTQNNDVARVGETSIRSAFGFYHPNNFAVYTMILGLEFIYLYKNSKKMRQFIFILIIFGLNYFFTDSRAAMIIEILIFIYLIIPKKTMSTFLENKFTKKIVTFSFIILLTISIILGLNYSNAYHNWIYKIDKITSGRIALSSAYIQRYSLFSNFGNKIPEANRYIGLVENPNYVPLDNGYIHLILEFGPLVTTLFLIFYLIAFKRLYKSNKHCLIIILFFLNLYLVMEATTYNVLYNPFLLIFATAFYDNINGIDIDLDENN